ncbi:MAG: RNA 2',3'-cyclic phosphodiesterase [Vicinamibacterales bacterium]
MRLFVAVQVGADVAAAAGALQRDLRRRADRLAPSARVTWVAPAALHLTLRFLGEIDPDAVPAIERVLAPPLEVEAVPLVVTFSGVGLFPPRGAPRVVWSGVVQGADGLGALALAIGRRLAEIGLPPEPRAFAPHLTLGRVRRDGGLRSSWIEGLATAPLGTVPVASVALVESRLRPEGPDHRTRLETPLVARPTSR